MDYEPPLENRNNVLTLPPKFTDNFRKMLMDGEFEIESWQFSTSRKKITDYLETQLGEEPNAPSYLSEPLMWDVDRYTKEGKIDISRAKDIKERVRDILVLLPLIDTYDFRLPKGWEEGRQSPNHRDYSSRNQWHPGINLRRLILTLAAEANLRLDENIFFGLNSAEFTALTRKTLVDSIRLPILEKDRWSHGFAENYKSMDINNILIDCALTDEEVKLLQIKFLEDGYLRESAERLLKSTLVFNRIDVIDHPAEYITDILRETKGRKATVEDILQEMNPLGKPVSDEIKARIQQMVDSYDRKEPFNSRSPPGFPREQPPIYFFPLDGELPDNIFIENSSEKGRLNPDDIPYYHAAVKALRKWHLEIAKGRETSGIPEAKDYALSAEVIGDIEVGVYPNGNIHFAVVLRKLEGSDDTKLNGYGVTIRFGEQILLTFPADEIIGRRAVSSPIEMLGKTKDVFDKKSQMPKNKEWQDLAQVNIE